MKFAKTISKTNDISIKTMLHERIPGFEDARSNKIIHASQTTRLEQEFCPREIVLLDISKKKGKRTFVGTSQRITYDLGRALQNMFNNEWLHDVMFGCWRCVSCGTEVKDCSKPKGHCGKSGVICNWDYDESRFVDPESGIGGGIDALIKTKSPKLRLTEVKTIDKDYFKDLKAPMAEHRLRTNLYMRLVDLDGRAITKKVNTKIAHVLYICKGFGIKDTDITQHKTVKDNAFSPFKEYTVQRDDSETDELLDKAKLVTQHRKGTGGMPCGVCKSSFDKRAKSCPVIKECWSGQFPSQTKW